MNEHEQEQMHTGEAGDVETDIDAMIADLESLGSPDVDWAIDELREIRAELADWDHLGKWAEQRVDEWNQRLMQQLAGAIIIGVMGGRMWRSGESAADLERDAQRIRGGQAASRVPQETREREAELLGHAAKLLRDKTALFDEVIAFRKALDSRAAETEENNVRRDHMVRTFARLLNDPAVLHRLNLERRKHAGRGRGKKR
jgi:hypothetical protein